MPKHHHTQNLHILMEYGSKRLLMNIITLISSYKEVTNHKQTFERTVEKHNFKCDISHGTINPLSYSQ